MNLKVVYREERLLKGSLGWLDIKKEKVEFYSRFAKRVYEGESIGSRSGCLVILSAIIRHYNSSTCAICQQTFFRLG